MRPETEDFLAKAQEDLSDARIIAAAGLAKVAARSAYYAAFHTAEALLVEKTGKIVKTHSGVRSEIAKLIRAGCSIDKSFPTFLAQAYKYKELSDYAVTKDTTLTAEEAEDAVAKAQAFLSTISIFLEGEPPAP